MNLYGQLGYINNQCQARRFTELETNEVMRLCVYACLGDFPARDDTLPFKNHVLTSIRPDKHLAVTYPYPA